MDVVTSTSTKTILGNKNVVVTRDGMKIKDKNLSVSSNGINVSVNNVSMNFKWSSPYPGISFSKQSDSFTITHSMTFEPNGNGLNNEIMYKTMQNTAVVLTGAAIIIGTVVIAL